MGMGGVIKYYQIKKDADLVAMVDDVTNFLNERFPGSNVENFILSNLGSKRLYSNEPAYKPLLRIVQEARKCDFDHIHLMNEKENIDYSQPSTIISSSIYEPENENSAQESKSHTVVFQLGEPDFFGLIPKLGKSRIQLCYHGPDDWTKAEEEALLEVLRDYTVRTEEPNDKPCGAVQLMMEAAKQEGEQNGT